MKKFLLYMGLFVLSAVFLTGCTAKDDTESSSKTQNQSETSDKDNAQSVETKEERNMQIITYFPNWKLGQPNGNVSDIPWDKVTIVNHAFWAVVPDGVSEESSFARRAAGEPARTSFKVVSTQPEADKIIFKDYEQFHEQYPDVKIMISIGGWSACGFFSEMAYTAEGRKGCIDSIVELVKANPWIGGIDIDWEYPSGSNDGERKPEGPEDQGCPVWGSSLEDRINFPLFLKEVKEALDANFGEGTKLLTACASSSTGWTLPNQDWVEASKYLDYINIMTYDMAGDWDGVVGHAAGVAGTKNAMAYFINKLVDKTKLNIGLAFYGTGFRLADDASFVNPVGQKIKKPNGISKEMLTIPYIRGLEAQVVAEDQKGWHRGYDERNGGAYLYNDDENSEQYRWFISFESQESIEGKIALIDKYNLAGFIVWEITQDTLDHEMINMIK